MSELGWHMQIWADRRILPEIASERRELPITVVIDYMLGVKSTCRIDDRAFQTLLRLLGDGKCWVKLSGANHMSSKWPDYEDVRIFHEALIKTNPEQFLWATSWPHPQVDPRVMPNDGHLPDLFNLWTPNEEIRRGILVKNPAILYRFDR